MILTIICWSSLPTYSFNVKNQFQIIQQSIFMKRKEVCNADSVKHREYYSAHNPYLNLPFPVSKELVLFDAYLDSRSRSGHRNLTMIFIAASRGVLEKKSITGCGVGISTATHFHVRYTQEDKVVHSMK